MTTNGRRPLIVTAADQRFARSLMQFLLSVERQSEHLRCRVVIYDLGLSDADLALLRRRFGWAGLQKLAWEDYPAHVGLSAGSYAWKPVMMWDAARQTGGPLLWFDSATVLRQPLDEVLKAVEDHGFWALRSQMPLAAKCDPRVLDALDVPLEARHIREYAAGAVGFDLGSPLGQDLLADWRRHALVAEHIIPEGYPAFHKHDQAVLNCLLAKAMAAGRLAMPLAEVDISSARPSPLISTRNFVSGRMPLWLDPIVRLRQALLKWGDTAYHRLRRFDDTVLDGLRRRRRDHFEVRVRDLRNSREVIVPGPDNGYYADPFVTGRDGRLWLFMEAFIYPQDRGGLAVVELDDDLSVKSARRLEFGPDFASLDTHASFPYVFELAGIPCMIPETHERQAIDLYECEQWPVKWRLRRRLRFGVDAADSMVIEQGGLWYLFTSVQAGGPNRHLEIHYTSDLLSGHFTAHPVNDQKRYGSSAYGTGRNAGYIGRQADGTLVRLIQNSKNFYGEGVRPMRITRLTPTEFDEEPIETIDFLPGISSLFPTHHATRAGHVLAFDIRDRVS